MVQSVELLLDSSSDEAIRREWNYLAELGLPSQARHTGSSNRPHITIAVAAGIDDDAERRLTALIVDGRENGAWRFPEAVRLGGLVMFGGSRAVLARAVVPSPELLDCTPESIGSWPTPPAFPLISNRAATPRT